MNRVKALGKWLLWAFHLYYNTCRTIWLEKILFQRTNKEYGSHLLPESCKFISTGSCFPDMGISQPYLRILAGLYYMQIIVSNDCWCHSWLYKELPDVWIRMIRILDILLLNPPSVDKLVVSIQSCWSYRLQSSHINKEHYLACYCLHIWGKLCIYWDNPNFWYRKINLIFQFWVSPIPWWLW